MDLFPRGRDKMWCRINAYRWMREYGRGYTDYQQLARAVAQAFGVEALLAPLVPGEHWIWDVAIEAIAQHERDLKASGPTWPAATEAGRVA